MDPGGATLVPDAGTYGQAILTIFDTTADMSALSVGDSVSTGNSTATYSALPIFLQMSR